MNTRKWMTGIRSRKAGCLVLVLAASSLVTAGCSRIRQTRSVERAGFLSDYSLLRKGKGEDPLLTYINPRVDISKYDKVLLESITLWEGKNFTPSKLSREEQQALTDGFYQALHRELGEDYEMVNHPGPGVLRIRCAITEAEASNVALDVVTTTVPQVKLISTVGGMATDTAVIVGEAAFEGEVTDSLTNELLGSVVDKRVGTKTFAGVFSSWDDVQAAFDKWAQMVRKRLANLRSESREGN